MKNREDAIFTIPNMLSVFRVLLIPLFMYLYFEGRYIYSTAVLLFSGLTDIVDGFIARRFNMITKLGKILDPLADKITQVAIAICLATNHTILIPLLIVFCTKELLMLIGAYVLLKKGMRPSESKWWGKIGTVIIYALLVLFLISDIIPNIIPEWALIISMCTTAVSILYSLYSYFNIYLQIRSGKYDIAKESHNKE